MKNLETPKNEICQQEKKQHFNQAAVQNAVRWRSERTPLAVATDR